MIALQLFKEWCNCLNAVCICFYSWTFIYVLTQFSLLLLFISTVSPGHTGLLARCFGRLSALHGPKEREETRLACLTGMRAARSRAAAPAQRTARMRSAVFLLVCPSSRTTGRCTPTPMEKLAWVSAGLFVFSWCASLLRGDCAYSSCIVSFAVLTFCFCAFCKATCEMCGMVGVRDAFYSKTKRFCSVSCSRSYSSNSKKASILARLQVSHAWTISLNQIYVHHHELFFFSSSN